MAAERADNATLLHRIHELAVSARDAAPDAMRMALGRIAELAAPQAGDTLEPSDPPQTENQSL